MGRTTDWNVWDLCTDAFLIVDDRGIVIDINTACCTLWGVDRLRVVGQPLGDAIQRQIVPGELPAGDGVPSSTLTLLAPLPARDAGQWVGVCRHTGRQFVFAPIPEASLGASRYGYRIQAVEATQASQATQRAPLSEPLSEPLKASFADALKEALKASQALTEALQTSLGHVEGFRKSPEEIVRVPPSGGRHDTSQRAVFHFQRLSLVPLIQRTIASPPVQSAALAKRISLVLDAASRDAVVIADAPSLQDVVSRCVLESIARSRSESAVVISLREGCGHVQIVVRTPHPKIMSPQIMHSQSVSPQSPAPLGDLHSELHPEDRSEHHVRNLPPSLLGAAFQIAEHGGTLVERSGPALGSELCSELCIELPENRAFESLQLLERLRPGEGYGGEDRRASDPRSSHAPSQYRESRQTLEFRATVLVVEDDPDVAELLSSTLELLGCRCLLAGSVAAARPLLRQEWIDLVSLDVVMPKDNGVVLLEEMSRDSKLENIPVLVVSGYTERLSPWDLKILGAAPNLMAILSKPVKVALLEEHIRSALLFRAQRVLLLVSHTPGERGGAFLRGICDSAVTVVEVSSMDEGVVFLKRHVAGCIVFTCPEVSEASPLFELVEQHPELPTLIHWRPDVERESHAEVPARIPSLTTTPSEQMPKVLQIFGIHWGAAAEFQTALGHCGIPLAS